MSPNYLTRFIIIAVTGKNYFFGIICPFKILIYRAIDLCEVIFDIFKTRKTCFESMEYHYVWNIIRFCLECNMINLKCKTEKLTKFEKNKIITIAKIGLSILCIMFTQPEPASYKLGSGKFRCIVETSVNNKPQIDNIEDNIIFIKNTCSFMGTSS